ncbi:MAG: putative zinc-binding metallopeptidase [Pseudomonadota bacterium]
MRVFTCPSCAVPVVFDNTQCLSCGALLHFDPRAAIFVSQAVDCRNRAEIGCNWRSAAGEGGLCWSCEMTEVIPDTFHGDNIALWSHAERAKRRVLDNLGRWGWFTPDDPGPLPRFKLLSEETRHGERRVVMAHASGEITINVTEADIVERVQRRETLGERLRTMVGHFRHEIAHFLFERLRDRAGFLEAFRASLGDERADYAEALAAYYENGPPAQWEQRYITRYAASHPHEDWAESVAHLMHLTDLTDCAASLGLQLPNRSLPPDYDPYAETDTEELVTLGAAYAMALNHFNRSIGVEDLYPFILTDAVRAKLAFVHRWVRQAG